MNDSWIDNVIKVLNNFSPLITLLLLLVLIALLVWVILLKRDQKKLERKLDIFMRGKDATSLEDITRRALQDIRDLRTEAKSNKAEINALRRQYSRSCSKLGVVKYNGFVGMGGKASFALCVLDNTNTGVIINVIHSRDGSYPYIKEVTNGVCETNMSEEERSALEMAIRTR